MSELYENSGEIHEKYRLEWMLQAILVRFVTVSNLPYIKWTCLHPSDMYKIVEVCKKIDILR